MMQTNGRQVVQPKSPQEVPKGSGAQAVGSTTARVQQKAKATSPLALGGRRKGTALSLECIVESSSTSSSHSSAGANNAGANGAAPQGSHSATVHLGGLTSFDDLRAAVQAAFAPGLLPPQPQAKLVYLDADGDWMMITRDDHWASFCATARKLLVTDRC